MDSTNAICDLVRLPHTLHRIKKGPKRPWRMGEGPIAPKKTKNKILANTVIGNGETRFFFYGKNVDRNFKKSRIGANVNKSSGYHILKLKIPFHRLNCRAFDFIASPVRHPSNRFNNKSNCLLWNFNWNYWILPSSPTAHRRRFQNQTNAVHPIRPPPVKWNDDPWIDRRLKTNADRRPNWIQQTHLDRRIEFDNVCHD